MDEQRLLLQKYLHEQIPISKAIGIQVKQALLNKVVLSAPIAPNINHKQTVFGGSLHAVATLSCWSLLHLNLRGCFEGNHQIVITHSEIFYKAPVDLDFHSECCMPDDEAWNRFIKAIRLKKKARIFLQATIYCRGRLAVDFRGTFAVIPDHTMI